MESGKETYGSDVAFVINVHKRLVRDFPKTPYNNWCNWVHAQNLSPIEKLLRIIQWDIVPHEYDNATLFASDYQLRSLLSKFSTEEYSDEVGEEVAYRKFLDSERRCELVNNFYMSRTRPSGVNQLTEYTKKIIAEVLGDVGDLFTSFSEALGAFDTNDRLFIDYVVGGKMSDLPDGFEFGPGVSVSARKKGSSRKAKSLESSIEKLSNATVTHNCWSFIGPVMRKLGFPRPSLVKGSQLTFAAKKVGELRAICYEASINMLFQKWVGRLIRRKLKAYFGIDLRDQTRNKRCSKLGSVTKGWATIDLTSASDHNAYVYVLEVVPPEWFKVLDSLRSRGYHNQRGELSEFQKFSTMGNGFTFELETLIFAAVTLASIRIWGDASYSPRDIICYGDDICVETRFYDIVVQGLTVIGHTPNLEKSFKTGPFRESCGGDYFDGLNVTPVRIKELRLDDPTTVIDIHNRLIVHHRSDSDPSLIGPWCQSAVVFIRDWLLRHYPRISGGPTELAQDKKNSEWFYQSSNQWLWDYDSNLAPHGSERKRVPKYLCVRVVETICEYHVPPLILDWFIGLGGTPTVLTKEYTKFEYNPDCYSSSRLKKDATKRAAKKAASISHIANKGRGLIV